MVRANFAGTIFCIELYHCSEMFIHTIFGLTMMDFLSSWSRLLVLSTLLMLSACATNDVATKSVAINLVALNDFHGHLEAGKFTYTSMTDQQPHTVTAGGIAAIGAALQAWRLEDQELLFVGAGDLVGASPAMSAMWADEPSINAMNFLGLRASSVGNHEFDAGRIELLRQQNGGCQSSRPDLACKLKPGFEGAQFTYLAANVIDHATGKPVLPAYRIEQAHGIKIAFIGAVLKDTASVALASGIAGLDFIDEADAINAVLAQLKAQGVGVFVVLIHQGGSTDEYFDQPDCRHLQGPIVDIVKRLDPAIRVVISGHSHTAYLCRVDGRLVTQAEMGGHVLSRIELLVDAPSNRVTAVSARNVVMQAGAYPDNAVLSAYQREVSARSATALMRLIGQIAVPLVSRTVAATGESALGDLLADSALAATHDSGAQIAFMNNGGMRNDLEAGEHRIATFGQCQIVLPFGNTLVLMNLSGLQIRALLEQQWHEGAASEHGLLQISNGFSYVWDGLHPRGHRVQAGSMMLHGVMLDERQTYRVVVNNFLSEGGDHFSLFTQGTQRLDSGVRDIDALTAYLASSARSGKPAGSAVPAGRILRIH